MKDLIKTTLVQFQSMYSQLLEDEKQENARLRAQIE